MEEARRRSCQPRSVFRGRSRILCRVGEEEVVPAKVSIKGDLGRIQGSLAVMAAGEGGDRAVKNRMFKNQDTSTTNH